MMVFPSSSEMTSLYIGRSDPTLPRSEGLNGNNDGTERGKGVNVQRRLLPTPACAHVAHMSRLQFPVADPRGIFAATIAWSWVALTSCGPPSWPGGIHALLGWSEAGVRVVEVPADSPAARAGLQAGDRILQVDGKPLAGRSSQDVQKLLTGEVGSTASLEVLRDGERLALQVVREPYRTKGVGP